MSARGARLLAALAGLLVGAVSLAVAFRGTSPSVVWGVLRAGHWVGAGSLVLASTAAFVYAKAMRWRLLLGAAPRAGLWLVLPPVLTGLALNAIVPHSGEFARAISLQRRAGRAAAAVLSSIVAERVFDLFGVLILGATALTTVAVNQRLEAAMRLFQVGREQIRFCHALGFRKDLLRQ